MSALPGELGDARDQVVDLAYAAAWSAVKNLPQPVAARVFRSVADSATMRNGRGVRQLRRNLRRVTGGRLGEYELSLLVTDAMRSYARYWLETFRLPRMDKRAVVERADRTTFGIERLDAARDAGNGVIVALPHMGNWEVAGLWVVDNFGPFTTVAERLRPDSLYDRFVAYRRSLGMEVLPATGGDRSPALVLAERLRAGGRVCLVADRDLSRHGVEVDFFGETALMPAGPAMLAARTGATLLPVGLWFTPDGGWGQLIGEPVQLRGERLADQVRNGTQALADAFAGFIAAHPADWHMLQKVWAADLTARRPLVPAR